MKQNIALKIAITYFILGFIWILFSDHLMMLLTDEISSLTKLQHYKGWFFITITAILLYVLISNEIGKKNKIAEELKGAMLKAEESDRLKTAFLSNMSHEIRTPLNGILGFSSLICEKDYENEEERCLYMDQVTKNSDNLMSIINDIIDISKIQENQLEIHMKKFDLNDLLNQLYDQYKTIDPKIKSNELSLQKRVANPNESFFIYSDPDRVRQILINLLNNAIKYTPSGEILFGYEVTNDGIVLFVQDNGIGINEEEKSQLFDRFNRTDATINKEGFGLGLAISKGLVEALGGKIKVESAPGKGSRFDIDLPHKN